MPITNPSQALGRSSCTRYRHAETGVRRLGVFESLESRHLLATFLVTNAEDAGPGSLRQALFDANSLPGSDLIAFSLAESARTIRPESELPWITDPVNIDATTQPGYLSQPLVELSGELLVANSNGLNLRSQSNVVRGLAINRFPISGIDIRGGGFNIIAGNFIGIDLSGEQARPNGRFGLHITSHANLIGGAHSSNRNVISGNGEDGIRIWGDVANSNLVMGNYIGTNFTGSTSISNGREGVLIASLAFVNTVGTNGDGVDDELEGNLIAGNVLNGVRITTASFSNRVAGNLVGVAANGIDLLPNLHNGILIDLGATGNIIGVDGNGVSDSVEKNLLSGNLRNGVAIVAANANVVAGNFIGVGIDGVAAKPNHERGVLVSQASQGNLIGTNDDGLSDAIERNIISGNNWQGIYLAGLGTERNTIAGNFVGLDASGQQAVANSSTGILVGNAASNNIIGVSETGPTDSVAGNVISGNDLIGVRFRHVGTTGNLLAGNRIGTRADGTIAVPNLSHGISSFEGAMDNTIGGSRPQDANVISGNSANGISIEAGSGGSTIIGNLIGMARDGISAIPNGESGIKIDGANDNRIGDGTQAGSNRIASNGSNGVTVVGASLRNSIAYNSIYGNVSPQIDLGGDGPNDNDALDADVGPNGLQNHPIVRSAALRNGELQVAGSLESNPSSDFVVELYATQDATSMGSSSDFLGMFAVRTDFDGTANWWFEVPWSLSAPQSLTAIATGTQFGTSENSASLNVSLGLKLGLVETKLLESQSTVLSIGRGAVSSDEEVIVDLSSSNPDHVTLQSSVTIPAQQSFVDVTVSILNDDFAQLSRTAIIYASAAGASGAIPLTLLESDLGWHNFDSPLDVSGNELISAFDVLQVVNAINSRLRNVVDRPPLEPRLFLDVNNDAIISGLDALQIINFLNAKPRGEGEAAPMRWSIDALAGPSTSQPMDRVFENYDWDWLAEDAWRRRRVQM